jgi:hypothetical protein
VLETIVEAPRVESCSTIIYKPYLSSGILQNAEIIEQKFLVTWDQEQPRYKMPPDGYKKLWSWAANGLLPITRHQCCDRLPQASQKCRMTPVPVEACESP